MSDPAKDKMAPVGNRPVGLGRFVPVGIILLGLALAYSFGLQDYLSLNYLADRRDLLVEQASSQPFLAAGLFFVIYVSAVAFSLPAATVLTVFGGFLFGWKLGGTLVVFAATIGATILFLAAKSSFGSVLRNRLGDKGQAFAEGLEKDAFGYLLVLRLAPIVPFFVVNVAPALFAVKTRPFVLATFFGIMPGTFAYAWLGEGVGSVLDAAKASGAEPSVSALVTPEITIAFAALAAVAAIPLILRMLKART